MSRNDDIRRIVIAITESSPVAELWEAALRAASEAPADLVAVYIHDERWRRAASLPFTREVRAVGGTSQDFTLQRAAELLEESVADLRARIEQLAEKAGYDVAFQVMPESDETQARTLFQAGASVVVSTSALAEHPVMAELRRLELKLLVVE
jgi:hypothetical protein